ncbi:acyltransferase [Devosia sp.]|uniref:acyltransferase family protein n=1 Tax=Devosia sp. TaxID=1871048 RepID=UPI0032635DD1
MDSENRLLGADFLRCTACFVVMLHHCLQHMGYSRNFDLLGWTGVFGIIGGLGVAMFFVLSGYLLARPFWKSLDQGAAMPSLRIYVQRRAARILPGFWLAMTVTFILTVTVFHYRLDGWLALRYLSGMLLISDWHWTTLFPVEVNGPLWSIGFEVSSYVFLPLGFALMFWASRIIRQYWLVWITWLVVIAATLGLHWLFVNFVHVDKANSGWDYGLQGGAKTWMPRFNPFSMFVIFAVGALAAGLQVKLARLRHLAFDALSLLSGAVAIYLILQTWMRGSVEDYGLFGVPYSFPLLPLALGAFLAVTPSTRFVGVMLDNRLVRYLASISFGIYVWHVLAIELVQRLWLPPVSNAPDQGYFALGVALVVAISIVAGSLSFKYLEEPIIRWARMRESGYGPKATSA